MTVKEARANIRKALALLKVRVKFPKIRLKDVLESEDIKSIVKEFISQKLQKFLGGR